jgi:hypothetical protein
MDERFRQLNAKTMDMRLATVVPANPPLQKYMNNIGNVLPKLPSGELANVCS